MKINIAYPLVSILTPGWNGVNFVHRLLDSILSQTYDNMEYIYVDDGSTDGTKDVVLSYKEKFEKRGIAFKYIWKENGGVSSAVVEGLKHVKGQYLCWPEYDDWLTPDSVERKVAYLEAHPDCAVVTSDAWLVNESNIKQTMGVLSRKNPNRHHRSHFVPMLLSDTIFTAACHMCRMDKFDETHSNRHFYIGPTGPNVQLLLPLYYKYSRGFIEEPLCYYLFREDSISNGNQKTFDKQVWAIGEFINVFRNTLDIIEMPDVDRKLYMDMVLNKYANDRIVMGYKSMNKEIFDIGFAYYKEHKKEIPTELARYVKIMNSSTRAINFFMRRLKSFIKK